MLTDEVGGRICVYSGTLANSNLGNTSSDLASLGHLPLEGKA